MKAISKKYIRPRQFFACLLVLAMMMVSVPAYAADDVPFAGSGTQADPYLMTSAADLLKLAELVNDGVTAFASAGVCYKLTQDINLSAYGKSYNSGKGWVPIGVGDALNPFNGNVNGDGHKITGLYINDLIANAGLFGIVSASATVENVILNGAEIKAINNVGGIAGEVKGTVTDCAYLSLADGTDLVTNTMNSVGGIAGYVDTGGIVKNCYSTGRVGGVSYIGGVAGTVDGTVHDCYSTSYVNGSNHVGGVAGQVNGTVQNCYSTGIIGGMSFVGGVTGMSDGTVQFCAALNLYVSASNSGAGRVAGVKNGGSLSNNMAFGGMNISVNGVVKDTSATARHNDVDGETRIAGVLQMRNAFPAAMTQSPWVYASGNLPGLGAAINMPSHLIPPVSDLAITTDSLPGGMVGTTYNMKLEASGGSDDPTNYTWSATGLPLGMRLTLTGRLLGVPAAANSYSARITVTDSSDNTSVTKVIPLIIAMAQDSPLSHWHERSEPFDLVDIPIYDIAYGGNTFVGVGESDAVMISADGSAWTADVDVIHAGQAYQGVAYGEGTFVVVGRSNSSGITSTKSGTGAWTTPAPSGSGTLECVTYAGNSTFISAGRNTILISNDLGVIWSSAATLPSLGDATFAIHGIAADGNGNAVAAGEASNGHSILWYSDDNGNTWSATDSFIEGTGLNGLAYGNHVFVAVGNDGPAYFSGDGGCTWDYAELPGAQDPMPTILYKVAFGENTFVAVGQCEDGQYNVISSSDNGMTWTERVSDPSLDLQAVAYGNNSFITAGYAVTGAGKLYQSDPLTFPVITTGTISGTVTDGTNPVSGAAVSLTVSGSVYSAATAANGSYSIPNVPEGAGYTVTAGKSGYNSGSASNVSVTANSTTSGVNITLAAIPPVTTYTITLNANGGSVSPSTMQTGVDGKVASLPTPTISGSYSFDGWFTAAASGSAVTANTVFTVDTTVYAHWTYTGGGSGIRGSYTPAPKYEASVSGGDDSARVEVKVDANNATAELTAAQIVNGREIVVDMPKNASVSKYTLGIPVPDLSKDSGKGAITLNTEAGNITLPDHMLAGTSAASGNKAQVHIGTVKSGDLPKAVQDKVGNRPIVSLSLSVDGKTTAWNNPNTPVTVTIPYTPTAEELKNPKGITVWYIDGSGKLTEMSGAKYDPVTKNVVFTTTHFSFYAVGYMTPVPASVAKFTDVLPGAWYYDAVTFIANKGITSGTGEGKYSPDATLTRGQFIVMLMRAYGIEADANPTDNFSDAGNTYYTGYLAAAKRLGISGGVGSNMFAPGKQITRQEMFTLLYNTLKAIGKLPQGNVGKPLSSFSDAGQIALWAKDAMALMSETGIIGGDGGKLSPTNATTRAEMAQVLYNLLTK